jgi:hypothetical protein
MACNRLMKRIIMILLIFYNCDVHAQTLKEWTQQKKTQLKYLINQIAALQVYASYLEKGYDVTKNGLDAIQNIKKGDFSIHASYFNSLQVVNPKIKNYWKVAAIVASQINILKSCKQQVKSINASGQFTPGEVNYFRQVFTNLMDGCSDIIDQMIILVTDGKVQMTDDERITRINDLYADILDKYEFVQNFRNETNILSMQRLMNVHNIQTDKALLNMR